jgi:uncharacterized damage-inducible protein DinB
MISLELLTKHMAWANQEIYKEVKNLDPEVLDYFVVDKEWTVRTIMIYSQRLMGKPFSKFEFDLDSPNLIDDLMSELEKIDKSLIEQVYREDEEVTFETSKGESSGKVSVILSMMIFHATEHRAQIVAALDKNNERSINLDEYSIFGYLRDNN